MRKKTRPFTIFLLKSGRADVAVRSSLDLTEIPVGKLGTLYIRPSHTNPPSWLSFFASVATLPDTVFNSNTAAVFIVPRAEHVFAVTFGYGRGLLEPGCWEEDFGLRVTLNSVDENKLRSVDRMSLDAIGQHSQIQASREANIREFGLDFEQDLLRAVTGNSKIEKLGKHLTGKDAIRLHLPIEISELPAVLDALILQWQSQDYKEKFPWIDQISEVKDQEKKTELDEALTKAIQAYQPDGTEIKLWLTIPELINWSEVDGFKYRHTKSEDAVVDVHLADFLATVEDRDLLTVDLLKARHIYAVSEDDDQEVRSWTIYRCLYFELDQGRDTFLLTNGHWYKVGTTFLHTVNRDFGAIPKTLFALPEYDDATETAYNARVAEEDPTTLALMDEKTIPYPDPRNTIEFCDLYRKTKHIIHVKRYLGASAPLSHLIAQAVNSALVFKRDRGFRKAVEDKLPAAFKPVTGELVSDEYEVVFGIVSKSSKPLSLPFFSRLNLKNAYERLRELSYKASILKIKAVSGVPKPVSKAAVVPAA
jgi:uncharacterized protein (TIGR04141 family)